MEEWLYNIIFGILLAVTSIAGLMSYVESVKGNAFPMTLWAFESVMVWLVGSLLERNEAPKSKNIKNNP